MIWVRVIIKYFWSMNSYTCINNFKYMTCSYRMRVLYLLSLLIIFLQLHTPVWDCLTPYLCLILCNEKAFVVGHDWGASVGWHLSLLRPDRVKGLVTLSAPYFNRNPSPKVIEYFRTMFGDGFYICQFQVPWFMFVRTWI